jgi:hypothetical protein
MEKKIILIAKVVNIPEWTKHLNVAESLGKPVHHSFYHKYKCNILFYFGGIISMGFVHI